MRAREFMEQAPFKTDLKKELQKDYMPDPSSIPIEKDWRTDPSARAAKEREQALQEPPISPEDLLGITGLAKSGAKRLAKTVDDGGKISGKLKNLSYDIKNKPSPINPLTINKIGSQQGTAKYHADMAFRKKYGMEPPTYDIPKDTQRFGSFDKFADASKNYANIEQDFVKRGYKPGQGLTYDIGHNIDNPGSILYPKPVRTPRSTKDKIKDVVDKVAWDTSKSIPLDAIHYTSSQIDKKANNSNNTGKNK